MLRRFHHFTELKKNFEIRPVFPQSISAITVQVISNSIRDLQSYRSLNIENVARGNFKQQPFDVLQETLNLANLRTNSIYQSLMSYVYSFWAGKKPRIVVKPFLCTRPLNFWLCWPVINVYIVEKLFKEPAKSRSNDFFLSCLNSSLGILKKVCQMATQVNISFIIFSRTFEPLVTVHAQRSFVRSFLSFYSPVPYFNLRPDFTEEQLFKTLTFS